MSLFTFSLIFTLWSTGTVKSTIRQVLFIIFLMKEFFTSAFADSFPLESEQLQVSRTFLSILANLNNGVVWMFYTLPLISKFSSPCTNPLVTVPNAPITIDITVTFMFHSFFLFPGKVSVFISLFAFLLGFWVMHIPFVLMVKFKLLAQSPVDYPPHPVVSLLILFLR